MADLTCVGRINLYFQKSFEWIQFIQKRKDINKFSIICPCHFKFSICQKNFIYRMSPQKSSGTSDSTQIKINLEKRKIF